MARQVYVGYGIIYSLVFKFFYGLQLGILSGMGEATQEKHEKL